jgi:predicted DsbA family dithiol-disulfide isomerase
MKVEIWSDVVCPWCYIGKRRFEQAAARFPHPVEVEWRSFELDPHAVGTNGGSYAERLAEKYGRTVPQAQEMLDSMTATAAAEGLDLHFDKAQAGSTFDAHRLLHLAKERGVQDAVKERLVRAYFTEGVAVHDHAQLVDVVTEAGLAADEAREVLAGDRYADEVRQDETEAGELGITGVPYFVIDRRYGVSGAQTPDVLLAALQQAWESQSPLTVVQGQGGGQACEGDACAV